MWEDSVDLVITVLSKGCDYLDSAFTARLPEATRSGSILPHVVILPYQITQGICLKEYCERSWNKQELTRRNFLKLVVKVLDNTFMLFPRKLKSISSVNRNWMIGVELYRSSSSVRTLFPRIGWYWQHFNGMAGSSKTYAFPGLREYSQNNVGQSMAAVWKMEVRS